MKILYIYRHPHMGFSIGRVFKPIEEEMRKYCEVDSIFLPVPNYSMSGLVRNIFAAVRTVKRNKYDIVHITGAEHYLIPFLRTQQVIVTVHDLESLKKTRKGLSAFLKELLFVKTLEMANRVTFISKKSENEGLAVVNIKKGRHCVIYNPVDSTYQCDKKRMNVLHPQVLHVGTKPNKNLIRVIIALHEMSIHLRIVGKLSDDQKKCLSNHNVEFSNVWNLSDEEILNEYKQCDIVCFPSLYEGFGMPIIEGQIIGRPVITSNIPPMNEIAEDSAVLVNPYDEKSIQNGLQEAIMNYEKYVSLGLENVKRFSLEKIVQQYYELYKSMYENTTLRNA